MFKARPEQNTYSSFVLLSRTLEMLSALVMLALMSFPKSRRPVANFAKRDMAPPLRAGWREEWQLLSLPLICGVAVVCGVSRGTLLL